MFAVNCGTLATYRRLMPPRAVQRRSGPGSRKHYGRKGPGPDFPFACRHFNELLLNVKKKPRPDTRGNWAATHDAPALGVMGMATWLSWTEAEVSTQETGIWPQATSMWSLYPVQVSL